MLFGRIDKGMPCKELDASRQFGRWTALEANSIYSRTVYILAIYVSYTKNYFISFLLIVTSLDCHRPFVLLFQMVFLRLIKFINVY
jgi:hypothetical protein